MSVAAVIGSAARIGGLCRAVALLGLCALAPIAGAEGAAPEPLPLWEAGAGAGSLWIPAYKGSATMRSYTAPLPYFVYRGEVLRANRDGIGLSMLGAERWRLDLSLSGALPVTSSGTRRNGMGDLPLVGELGPVLKYDFVDAPDRQVQLRLPLRYATGLHRNGLQSVGWISDPGIWVSGTLDGWGRAWEWGASVNADFQSGTYNRFYYGVDPRDATADRPAYRGAGGYSGVDVRAGMTHRHANLIVSGFVGLSDIAGSRFRDSPLVQRSTNYSAGVAVIWVFQKSTTPSTLRGTGEMQ